MLAVENQILPLCGSSRKWLTRNLSLACNAVRRWQLANPVGSRVTALALMRLLEQAGGLVQCDKMLLQQRDRKK